MIQKKYFYSEEIKGDELNEEAPMLTCVVYTPPIKKNPKGKLCDFCIDSGADFLAAIPEDILNEIGKYEDEGKVADYKGDIQERPIYSVGLRITGINFNALIRAVPTKRPFGFLPRRVLNEWKIELDGPRKEFTITTFYDKKN